MSNNITKKQFEDYFFSLSLEEVTKLTRNYDIRHSTKVKVELDKLYISELERKLIENGINSNCPFCNSTRIRKRGRNNNFQRFSCLDCNRSFTSVTNTFLEKSKFSWKQWIKILEMLINGLPVADMVNTLERDFDCSGLDEKTVFLAIHKILYAVYQIPQPILTGVIQIDETFFRETQKASKTLQNYLPMVSPYRKPRYGVQPSLLGTMGPEFATVPVAVDNSGHIVAKVACLGRLSTELFITLFHEHFDNPAFICSDANPIYSRYCQIQNIPQYIRPSDYYSLIKKSGYVQATYPNEELNQKVIEKNNTILEKLYNLNVIDRIENRGTLSFKEFQQIKQQYELSLGRVNQQHNELKKLINRNKTNVSTKYLDRYINFYAFIHNWSIDNKHYPSSNQDAEDILIYILKNTKNTTFTLEDLKNTQLTLPKPTKKYIDMLATLTSSARIEFNSKYLKFNEEDKVYNFKKREYLYSCPRAWLEEVAKQRGIKYSHHSVNTWSLITELLKQDDIDIIIVQLLLKEKHIHIDKEDSDLLQYFKISADDLKYDEPIDESIINHYPPVLESSPLFNPMAYNTGQIIANSGSDEDDGEHDRE